MKWGYIDEPNKDLDYSSISPKEFKRTIINSFGDDFYFHWYSDKGFRYASNYYVSAGSSAGWYESIHKPVSYFCFYLPVSEIRGVARMEKITSLFCEILQPIHGLMGLGMQQCQERERYQHLEYEIGSSFLGVDIPCSYISKCLRTGMRSVNWYTLFNNEWMENLGGMSYLCGALSDPAIKINPYKGSVIIQAGEYPELGWVNDNPYPELYVKVNKVLKLIRAPKIGSLGYGSIAGEIRFDKNSTAKWLSRFDVDLPSLATVPAAKDPVRITCWTDDIAPHAG